MDYSSHLFENPQFVLEFIRKFVFMICQALVRDESIKEQKIEVVHSGHTVSKTRLGDICPTATFVQHRNYGCRTNVQIGDICPNSDHICFSLLFISSDRGRCRTNVQISDICPNRVSSRFHKLGVALV